MIDFKQISNTFIGKLSYGSDLLEGLTNFCVEKNITLGKVEAIGAVQKACVAFYNHTTREYQYLDYDRPSELINLAGNISTKDDKPFVHAHITLADETGKAFGGHLAPGTIIFACEFFITVYAGVELKRAKDNVTGLYLWNFITDYK